MEVISAEGEHGGWKEMIETGIMTPHAGHARAMKSSIVTSRAHVRHLSQIAWNHPIVLLPRSTRGPYWQHA